MTMDDLHAQIQCVDLVKEYPSGTGQPHRVLDQIQMSVTKGQSLAIVGPSGCGKSTLLNCLGALDRPTSGQVLLDGTDLACLNENSLAGMRNQHIGFVFQMHHLLPQLTVLENVLLPVLAEEKIVTKEFYQWPRQLLERVGLAEYTHTLPSRLSGGQCQRVAVVRALVNQPEVLLADEPTGSLDETTAESLIDLLVELNVEQRLTVIMVTHSSTLAGRMEQVYRLRDGRLERDDA
jgi:lipoprotein-releasing system ATP-binding protein